MELKNIKDFLEGIKKVKVGVYGDFCLDAHWLLDTRGSEISVETGLKCDAVKEQYYNLGGASNVTANLAAMGAAAVYSIGLIGDDIFGKEILRQMYLLGIKTTYLETVKNYNTVCFGKRYLKGKELSRIDFGFFNKKTRNMDDRMLEGILFALENCDALIFNQQIPGSLTDYFIGEVNKIFKKYDDRIIILDSRHYNSRISNTYIKINSHEASRLCKQEQGKDSYSLKEVERFSRKIYSSTKKPVFITMGSRGYEHACL